MKLMVRIDSEGLAWLLNLPSLCDGVGSMGFMGFWPDLGWESGRRWMQQAMGPRSTCPRVFHLMFDGPSGSIHVRTSTLVDCSGVCNVLFGQRARRVKSIVVSGGRILSEKGSGMSAACKFRLTGGSPVGLRSKFCRSESGG